MFQLRQLLAFKVKEVAYKEASDDIDSERSPTQGCNHFAKNFQSELDDKIAKCKAGTLPAEEDRLPEFEEGRNSNIDSSDCNERIQAKRVISFKEGYKDIVNNDNESGKYNVLMICKTAKARYKAMELDRRDAIRKCSKAEKPKCQIADVNGNCPGSKEAREFEKQARIKRLNKMNQSPADKCRGGDQVACARIYNGSSSGVGK